MVSFQCDACQDVVKKPKLDIHSYRCYASFTCVDCSKTFHAPAEWKGHTSCISEEEKYQKGLYKGKKDKQNGPKGDKVMNNAPSKPITSQTHEEIMKNQSSGPEARVNNSRAEIGYPIGGETASNSISGDSKEKRRKHKSSKNQTSVQTEITIEEGNGEKKKKKKKKKLDTEEKEGEAKVDERPEDDVLMENAPQTSASSLADPVENRKKEKKRKDKKKKEKSVEGADEGENSAPPPTEPQPVASTSITEDNVITDEKPKKKKKGKPLKPESLEKGTIAAPTVPNLSAEPGAPSNNKKDKKRKAQEDASTKSTTEDDRSLETGTLTHKKRKRSDPGGDEGVIADSAEKTKKEKKKRDKVLSGVETEKNGKS